MINLGLKEAQTAGVNIFQLEGLKINCVLMLILGLKETYLFDKDKIILG